MENNWKPLAEALGEGHLALNATTGISSSLSSVGSWFGIVATVAVCSILIMLTIVIISSFERYEKFWRIIRKLKKSLGLFGWGVIAILIVSLPTIFIYWEIHQASNGNIVPIKWTVLPIMIYLITALIGYLFEKYVVNRIKEYNKIIKYKKKMKGIIRR